MHNVSTKFTFDSSEATNKGPQGQKCTYKKKHPIIHLLKNILQNPARLPGFRKQVSAQSDNFKTNVLMSLFAVPAIVIEVSNNSHRTQYAAEDQLLAGSRNVSRC